MSADTIPFVPSGTLEFEHIEVEHLIEKNKPVDEGANADDPTDRDPLSINFGRDKAHVPAAAERMLAGATIDWLIAFPVERRPKGLCNHFPHVANRLAANWSDRAASLAAVQALAEDARWGSVGFPALVQNELTQLLRP